MIGKFRQRLITEVGWLTTIVLAVLCELVVVAFASWLDPDIRKVAFEIWVAGAYAMFMLWVLGIYGRIVWFRKG